MKSQPWTAYFVVHVDARGLPPERPEVLAYFDTPEFLLDAIIDEDGRITARLAPADGYADAIVFQRVIASGPTTIVMCVTASEDETRLYCGPIELLPDEGQLPVVVATTALLSNELPSIERLDAKILLEDAISKRKTFFEDRQAFIPRESHRPKSESEQIRELEEALSSIAEVLDRPVTRSASGMLAAIMRGLLLAPTASATWNPLLLRIADRRGLPLPLYAPRRRTPPDLVTALGPRYFVNNPMGSVYPKPGDVLIDFVDYLESTVLIDSADGGRVTLGEVILWFASSSAPGHWDDTLRTSLDSLQRIKIDIDASGAETSALQLLIVETARFTLALGAYVLQR